MYSGAMEADPAPRPEDPGRPAEGGSTRPAVSETVYSHLRAIAQQQMSQERAGHTLSATALVHEAFVRMGSTPGAESRRSYMFAAAEAMRRILIEHARARGRVKRGGRAARVSLEAIGDVADLESASGDASESVFAFDEAFRRLEVHDAGVADVVRLRFYAGLTVPETAKAVGVSERTVNNRWGYARAWLAREMQGGASEGGHDAGEP
jgi:RNA polymerase sigma factor (TIGR02999 family)